MRLIRATLILTAVFSVPAAGLLAHDDSLGGQFTLVRQPGDLWRAQYCLDQEVTAIRWDTQLPGMRSSAWTVEGPRQQLVIAEDADALVGSDGLPFLCAAVHVETYTELGPKHYYAFSPFSDGGMSVFTGYFTGEAYFDGGWHELDLRAKFVGRPGETVIGSSRLQREFVYFGTQARVDTETAMIVVDPAVPDSVSRRIVQSMVDLDDTLYETLAWRPSEPYDVLIAAGQLDDGEGFSVKGGALDRQILFTLKGRGTLALAERDPIYFPKLVAHEVLHLWQNDLWPELGGQNPWMHEGSADALAADLLFTSGLIDADAYLALIADTRQTCVDRLAGFSVHGAPDDGRFDVVYSCGAVLNWLVAEAIGSGDTSAGLRRLWRSMASYNREARSGEGEQLWLQTIEQLGISSEAVTALRYFLATVHDDTAAALEAVAEILYADHLSD